MNQYFPNFEKSISLKKRIRKGTILCYTDFCRRRRGFFGHLSDSLFLSFLPYGRNMIYIRKEAPLGAAHICSVRFLPYLYLICCWPCTPPAPGGTAAFTPWSKACSCPCCSFPAAIWWKNRPCCPCGPWLLALWEMCCCLTAPAKNVLPWECWPSPQDTSVIRCAA